MAPGGTFFRLPPHFGENVLPHASDEWLPDSKDEVRLKSVNTNSPFHPHPEACSGGEGGHEQPRKYRVGIPQKLHTQQHPVSQYKPDPDRKPSPVPFSTRAPGLRPEIFSASHCHSSHPSEYLDTIPCILSPEPYIHRAINWCL